MKKLLILSVFFLITSCSPDLVEVGSNGVARVEVGPAVIDFDFLAGQITAQNLTANWIRVQVCRVEFPDNYVIFDHSIRRYPDKVTDWAFFRRGQTLQVNVYCGRDVYSDSFRFR